MGTKEEWDYLRTIFGKNRDEEIKIFFVFATEAGLSLDLPAGIIPKLDIFISGNVPLSQGFYLSRKNGDNFICVKNKIDALFFGKIYGHNNCGGICIDYGGETPVSVESYIKDGKTIMLEVFKYEGDRKGGIVKFGRILPEDFEEIPNDVLLHRELVNSLTERFGQSTRSYKKASN